MAWLTEAGPHQGPHACAGHTHTKAGLNKARQEAAPLPEPMHRQALALAATASLCVMKGAALGLGDAAQRTAERGWQEGSGTVSLASLAAPSHGRLLDESLQHHTLLQQGLSLLSQRQPWAGK